MRRLVLLLALAACDDTPEPLDDETRATLAFRADLAQLDRATTEYVARMERATATTCLATRNAYDLEVRPLIVVRMADLAPDLDQQIADHGGTGFGDLACITEALHVELDAHVAAECTVDDRAAEAQRHAVAVGTLLDAAYVRTDEMLAGYVFAAVATPCP